MVYNGLIVTTKTEKQIVGALGEEIASKYLKNMGFSIVERNYRKKCGEIDIIALKAKTLHFVEVKSVSCEMITKSTPNVSHETDFYRPEDNIHSSKLKRLARTIEIYLSEKFGNSISFWQFDAITVRIYMETKQAKVKFLENIIL